MPCDMSLRYYPSYEDKVMVIHRVLWNEIQNEGHCTAILGTFIRQRTDCIEALENERKGAYTQRI